MILFILIHIAAAVYNYYSILDSIGSPVYNRKWHVWQAAFNGIISFFLGLYLSPYFALQFLATRFLIFNPVLNELRDKGFFYLGKHGIDGVFIKLFGRLAGLVYFILGILLVVGLYFAHLHLDVLNYKFITK